MKEFVKQEQSLVLSRKACYDFKFNRCLSYCRVQLRQSRRSITKPYIEGTLQYMVDIQFAAYG
jgi:hypothetical protein